HYCMSRENLRKIEHIEVDSSKDYLLEMQCSIGIDIYVNIKYDVENVNGAVAKKLKGHYKQFLMTAMTNGNEKLRDIPYITSQEQDELASITGNQNFVHPLTINNLLHKQFEQQVKQTSDKIALIFKDEQLTYKDLNSKANQVAHYLINKGI